MDKDPITLEIIQNSLRSISDEMFAAMRKTAMSAIIYEVLDMGTAITTGDGELASSGAGIPAFSAMLDKSVQRILEIHSAPESIKSGDIFITFSTANKKAFDRKNEKSITFLPNDKMNPFFL